MAVVLTCDDIRMEATQRLSLVALFGPTVVVPEFPFLFPQVCAVMLVRRPAEPLRSIRIELISPEGTVVAMKNQPIEDPGGSEPRMYQYQLRIAPFLVEREGVWTFRFKLNGGEEIGMETTLEVSGPRSREAAR